MICICLSDVMSKMPNTANLDHGNDSKPTGKDNKSIEKANQISQAVILNPNTDFKWNIEIYPFGEILTSHY